MSRRPKQRQQTATQPRVQTYEEYKQKYDAYQENGEDYFIFTDITDSQQQTFQGSRTVKITTAEPTTSGTNDVCYKIYGRLRGKYNIWVDKQSIGGAQEGSARKSLRGENVGNGSIYLRLASGLPVRYQSSRQMMESYKIVQLIQNSFIRAIEREPKKFTGRRNLPELGAKSLIHRPIGIGAITPRQVKVDIEDLPEEEKCPVMDIPIRTFRKKGTHDERKAFVIIKKLKLVNGTKQFVTIAENPTEDTLGNILRGDMFLMVLCQHGEIRSGPGGIYGFKPSKVFEIDIIEEFKKSAIVMATEEIVPGVDINTIDTCEDVPEEGGTDGDTTRVQENIENPGTSPGSTNSDIYSGRNVLLKERFGIESDQTSSDGEEH